MTFLKKKDAQLARINREATTTASPSVGDAPTKKQKVCGLLHDISRTIDAYRTTVIRVLSQAGLPRTGRPRPSQIEPYLPFIFQTLEMFPTLTASRLYVMARERGYRGSPSHFRYLISCHRPRPKAEAYLRLRTLPGEQAQVDGGHFGHLTIGRARRPLMAFVMVLSYSRQIFLRFFLDARMENFLRGHAGAFAAWNGVPRVLLYDNLKSTVLERRGETTLLENMIVQDIAAGRGCALIDPHGDLVERVAEHVPAWRRDALVYLNVPEPLRTFPLQQGTRSLPAGWSASGLKLPNGLFRLARRRRSIVCWF